MRKTILLSALLAFAVSFPLHSQTKPAVQTSKPAEVTLLTEYTKATQAKDWAKAIEVAHQMVRTSPVVGNYMLLARAQLNSGALEESLATYDVALSASSKGKPAQGKPLEEWKQSRAEIYLWKGNTLLKLKRNDEAAAVYNQAAELSADHGKAYFNLCATLYNIGNTAESAAACRKSLDADPKRDDAWFILGSVLFAEAKINNGKVALSEEGRNALKKYIELAPDGPHAKDVKAMLDMLQ
jgi:tetratricopeptide (TPR) repeat protein